MGFAISERIRAIAAAGRVDVIVASTQNEAASLKIAAGFLVRSDFVAVARTGA